MGRQTSSKLIIAPQIRRRFILGKQGLWPGRRWQDKAGLRRAMREMEMVQIDPTVVVAPSQDLVLWGRVLSYRAAWLTDLLYGERSFFDYGGGLAISPMEEMPYTRVVMQRKAREPRWAKFAKENAALIKRVRRDVASRGPLSGRQLEGEGTNAWSYRSGKDSGVALYYLWLVGDLMISKRVGKERVYDLLEKVVPSKFSRIASVAEMEDYYAGKAISMAGIASRRGFRNAWKGFIERWVGHDEGQRKLAQMVAKGEVTAVELENEKDGYYVLTKDLPKLKALVRGELPKAWEPLETSTTEEATFLSPLELVSARGRAKVLFDFDYTWEIYKPQEKRKYGPYTMPILYGDQLVGRVDLKMDRATGSLFVNGVWLEPWFKPEARFKAAYGRGLARLAEFLGAKKVIGGKI